jgi:hypothetical protein
MCEIETRVKIHVLGGKRKVIGTGVNWKWEKKQDLSVYLATYWNLSYKCGDLETFFLEIWRIWAIFPMENPLYRSKSYFSGSNQKTLVWELQPKQF